METLADCLAQATSLAKKYKTAIFRLPSGYLVTLPTGLGVFTLYQETIVYMHLTEYDIGYQSIFAQVKAVNVVEDFSA